MLAFKRMFTEERVMQALKFLHFVRNRSNSDQQVYDALKTIDLSVVNAQGYDMLVRQPIRAHRPALYERVLRETVEVMLVEQYAEVADVARRDPLGALDVDTPSISEDDGSWPDE